MSILEEQPQIPADPEPIDGKITVFVAMDHMSAEAVITAPIGGGLAATEDDVLATLREARVQYGVDMEAIARAVAEAQVQPAPAVLPERIVVARGKPPVPGEDARIDYHPALTETGGRPRVRPDGTVDLLDLNLVHNIGRETVLAVITPAGRGEAGMTVAGVEIAPWPGRDAYLVAGKGTQLSDDRLTLTAAIDGHPTLLRGEVAVTDVYQVNGDVGVATGNVQFVGSVVVRGSISRGFKVKADGDVDVQGAIDGGHVDSSGNVIVRLGIAAGSRVAAAGSVTARFIESAEVRAGANVWAADGILQGRVEAGGGIEVLGRHGAIIGGRITAWSAVSTRVLGSPIGTLTEIAVGLSPQSHLEILENRKKRAVVGKEFQRVDDTIQNILARDQRALASQHVRIMLSKLARQQEELFGELEGLKARARELEQEAAVARGAKVQAREVCHPGVSVVIGKAQYRVARITSRPCFRLNDDLEIEAAASWCTVATNLAVVESTP